MAEEWSMRAWEDEQMKEARLNDETAAVVRRLLDAWLASTGAHNVDAPVAVETFTKLLRGEALTAKDDPSEKWAPVTQAGQVHTRDIVRVQADAYSDEAGRMHNLRRGRVIAVRYGDIVVRYEDGKQPPFDGVHHPPTKLEKRIA